MGVILIVLSCESNVVSHEDTSRVLFDNLRFFELRMRLLSQVVGTQVVQHLYGLQSFLE
jgi:hypothetical protein